MIKTDNDMKGRRIVYWACLLLAVSCESKNEGIDSVDPVLSARTVTFLGETEDVSVLIFGRNSTGFTYQKGVFSGWVNGRLKIPLERGEYKCLFYKSSFVHTELFPDLRENETPWENVKIMSRPDPGQKGYVLPADEVFLPSSEVLANTIYVVPENDTVRSTLTRAVGKIILQLKRGFSESGNIDSLPYAAGSNIMDEIEQISLDITGVGEAVNIAGGLGKASMEWTASSADRITSSGFAVFDGPFVFPPAAGEKTKVGITLKPKSGSPFPPMSRSVEGNIVRNEKLVITLWLTSTYRFVGVQVRRDPIQDETQGDAGLWE